MSSTSAREGATSSTTSTTRAQKTVLIDMDGVLCDFERHFLNHWRREYPDRKYIPLEERRSHTVDQDPQGVYDVRRQHSIMGRPGFYESMPPIAGGIEAVLDMDKEPGLLVRICTSPFGKDEAQALCVKEKREWMRTRLGEEWVTERKFVAIKDKTTVEGAVLIDDKPAPERVKGEMRTPSWQHVVFTQPYNTEDPDCSGKPRLNCWEDWRKVVLPLLKD